METFSALLAICAGNSPVTGEFHAQRPVTRSFDVFFDLRPNKRLSKQWWGWWFETPSCPLWGHCNAENLFNIGPGCRIKHLKLQPNTVFYSMCSKKTNIMHKLLIAATRKIENFLFTIVQLWNICALLFFEMYISCTTVMSPTLNELWNHRPKWKLTAKYIDLPVMKMYNTCMLVSRHLGPLLLTWFNFNPSMINNYTHYKKWDVLTYPFPNFSGVTVEV